MSQHFSFLHGDIHRGRETLKVILLVRCDQPHPSLLRLTMFWFSCSGGCGQIDNSSDWKIKEPDYLEKSIIRLKPPVWENSGS